MPARTGTHTFLIAAAVTVAVVISIVELVFLASFVGLFGVVVEDAEFEYSTPPTVFCSDLADTIAPPPVLHVRVAAVFNLTWTVVCAGSSEENVTEPTYVITSVAASTFGFTVVSSNVPVSFGYGDLAYFNVSVRAPFWPTVSDLTLTIQGT